MIETIQSAKGLLLNRVIDDIVIFPIEESTSKLLEELLSRAVAAKTIANTLSRNNANSTLLNKFDIEAKDVILVGSIKDVTTKDLDSILIKKNGAYRAFKQEYNYFCYAVHRYGTQGVELHSSAEDSFKCVKACLNNPSHVLIIKLPVDNDLHYTRFELP